MEKKLAILTSGGDAPGMNAAIRATAKIAESYGFEVYGIRRGYLGMLNDEIFPMTGRFVSGIIDKGGTVLLTARCEEFKQARFREIATNNLKKKGIEYLVVIGGDGSYRGAMALSNEMNIKTIGVPGTIDNDICCTDFTIGFDTALNTIVDAIDKVRDTASSHERAFIIEVMGRNAGDLALFAGIAGGSESLLIPEKKEDIEEVVARIKAGEDRGKKHSIIVLAEGVMGGQELAKELKERTGEEVRATILGHIQRGGTPSAQDRVLASRLGNYAVQLLLAGKSGRAVGIQNNKLVSTKFEDVFCDVHNVDLNIYEVSKQLSI